MTAKISIAPLWLILGLAAGLLAGWIIFGSRETAKIAVVDQMPAEGEEQGPVTLAAAERLFQKWGGYAVWENDITQLAVWNVRKHEHADFYEVYRVRGRFFFRSLQQLNWVLIDHGHKVVEPIWFAEPVAARAQFYQDNPDYDLAKEKPTKRRPLPPIGKLSQDPVSRP